MVNPFNGEGIAYAMESGALAAEVIVAGDRARSRAEERERALATYPHAAPRRVRRLLHARAGSS